MGQSQDSERKDEFLNKCLCVISTERIFKTISLDKITKQGKKKNVHGTLGHHGISKADTGREEAKAALISRSDYSQNPRNKTVLRTRARPTVLTALKRSIKQELTAITYNPKSQQGNTNVYFSSTQKLYVHQQKSETVGAWLVPYSHLHTRLLLVPERIITVVEAGHFLVERQSQSLVMWEERSQK